MARSLVGCPLVAASSLWWPRRTPDARRKGNEDKNFYTTLDPPTDRPESLSVELPSDSRSCRVWSHELRPKLTAPSTACVPPETLADALGFSASLGELRSLPPVWCC